MDIFHILHTQSSIVLVESFTLYKPFFTLSKAVPTFGNHTNRCDVAAFQGAVKQTQKKWGGGIAPNLEHLPVFRAPRKGGLGPRKNTDSVHAKGREWDRKQHTTDGHRNY